MQRSQIEMSGDQLVLLSPRLAMARFQRCLVLQILERER